MSLSLYPNVQGKKFFIQDESPSYAMPGDQWLNSLNGNIYIYARDAAGASYWIETGSNISGG
jgi:hypothetical protein